MLASVERVGVAALASVDLALAALGFLAIAVAGILIALAAALSMRKPAGSTLPGPPTSVSRYSLSRRPAVQAVDDRASLTIVDSLVFDYIRSHGGVISLGQASMDLRLDESELRRAIGKLAQRGLLEPY